MISWCTSKWKFHFVKRAIASLNQPLCNCKRGVWLQNVMVLASCKRVEYMLNSRCKWMLINFFVIARSLCDHCVHAECHLLRGVNSVLEVAREFMITWCMLINFFAIARWLYECYECCNGCQQPLYNCEMVVWLRNVWYFAVLASCKRVVWMLNEVVFHGVNSVLEVVRELCDCCMYVECWQVCM